MAYKRLWHLLTPSPWSSRTIVLDEMIWKVTDNWNPYKYLRGWSNFTLNWNIVKSVSGHTRKFKHTMVLRGAVSRGLATSWSPVQGVLPIVLDLVTEMKRKFYGGGQGPKLGSRATGKKIVLRRTNTHLIWQPWNTMTVSARCKMLLVAKVDFV
jgi:hypothetical protein